MNGDAVLIAIFVPGGSPRGRIRARARSRDSGFRRYPRIEEDGTRPPSFARSLVPARRRDGASAGRRGSV
jgi:hypothetical protein